MNQRKIHPKETETLWDVFYSREQCSAPLSYEKRKNQFCSRSCAATKNNTGRTPSIEQRKKTSQALDKGKQAVKQKRKEQCEAVRETRRKLIRESNIDTSKRGWVKHLATITGIRDNQIKKWLKRNMLDFYTRAYENK